MEASGGEGGISNTSHTSKNYCLLDPEAATEKRQGSCFAEGGRHIPA